MCIRTFFYDLLDTWILLKWFTWDVLVKEEGVLVACSLPYCTIP